MNKVWVTNNVLKTVLLLAVLFSFVTSSAQVRDTLKEVNIKAKAIRSDDRRINSYSPGQNIITIDEQTLKQYEFQDMANLLSQQVPVFVKSYGLNNLATLNFRGASAAQSQVYWNGIPIQNAALGIADVSLLPVALMNKVNVVYGSSSALWGSGNIGGALLVENDVPAFTDKSKFSQSASAVAGSFNHYRLGIKSEYKAKKLSLNANLFGQTARNNFSYTDVDGMPRTMANADLQSGVGLLQGAYRLNDYNTLTARAWYQQYLREIPPALFESNSFKKQKDESLRLMLEWKKNKGSNNEWYAKTAYIRDHIHYTDSTVNLNSRNRANQLYTEAGVEHNFSPIHIRKLFLRHKILVFAPVNILWMDNPRANTTVVQNRYAVAAAYRFNTLSRSFIASLNMRGEVVDDKSYALPGASARYALLPGFFLRGNIQRTYRVPTLNELYYVPGGNPALEPEEGWSTELGYTIVRPENKTIPDEEGFRTVVGTRRFSASHSLTAYNRIINNWIIWFGGAIWTPHNIAQVHSRGLQTENEAKYTISKNWQLRLSINAAYTLATTISSYVPGDGSIGKQIPYTPLYNGQGNLGFIYKKLSVNYNHTYTGLRYITVDESYGLRAYTIGNLQLMYSLKLGDNQLRFTGQVNNIFNTRYQVVNARPMPGTNWLLGVGYTIN